MRDEAVKKAFFNTPAALLQQYQHLMRRAGRDPNAAFPEGTWQFYINYALREDTARHACETLGFQQALVRERLRLSPVDRITTWVLTAVDCLHQYPDLLQNEWRERVYTHLLSEISYNPKHSNIYRRWERQRPFTALYSNTPHVDYPTFRKYRFDRFLATVLSTLPDPTRRDWEAAVARAEAEDLPAYQKQLNILAYLHPGQFEEERIPISIADAKIGLIIQGHYYTVPACRFGSDEPIGVDEVRNMVASILDNPHATEETPIAELVRVQRLALSGLRSKLSQPFQQAWQQIDLTPIWLNFDTENHGQPLAFLRQGERALGSHPLTIFDNGKSTVFDLSHIFFDGIWGATLAEILTNQAVIWAKRLIDIPHTVTLTKRPSPLRLSLSDEERSWLAQAPQVGLETSAESDAIDLQKLQELRRLFKKHIDFLELTVNDIMILYRAIHHAKSYNLNAALLEKLQDMQRHPEKVAAAAATLASFSKNGADRRDMPNPAILIPVDASRRSPRDRVYPMTFDIDIDQLDLEQLHQKTLAALTVLDRSAKNRKLASARFMKLQTEYLEALSVCGQILSKAKRMAVEGKSLSIDSIKLLANLPTPVQRFLDRIPNQFDVINDILKGREVFSNVGAVVQTSSLHRFITAKDDNAKKELAWGILTDAKGTMRITLRDFRPHIRQLAEVGEFETAVQITQDQLDSYVDGFNRFVDDLIRIFAFIQNPTDRASERPLPEPDTLLDKLSKPLHWLTALLGIGAVTLALFFLSRDPLTAQQAAATVPSDTAAVADPTLFAAIPPPVLASPTAIPFAEPTFEPTALATLPTPTRTAQPATPSAAPQLIQRDEDGMTMVYLPGGAFEMGAPDSDAAAEDNEKPRHTISLSPFFIDQHEVTVEQYVAFLNEQRGYVDSCLGYTCLSTKSETQESHVVAILNGSYTAEPGYETYPVNQISWHGAVAYCEWVNGRLPTEAEWEYAAGGSEGLLYPWGDAAPEPDLVIYDTAFSNLQPVTLVVLDQTSRGLFNMAGGVAEWVSDTYDPFYYVFSPEQDPTGLAPDLRLPRAIRGGSYLTPAVSLRITSRRAASATDFRGNRDVGFRCARDAQ